MRLLLLVTILILTSCNEGANSTGNLDLNFPFKTKCQTCSTSYSTYDVAVKADKLLESGILTPHVCTYLRGTFVTVHRVIGEYAEISFASIEGTSWTRYDYILSVACKKKGGSPFPLRGVCVMNVRAYATRKEVELAGAECITTERVATIPYKHLYHKNDEVAIHAIIGKYAEFSSSEVEGTSWVLYYTVLPYKVGRELGYWR